VLTDGEIYRVIRQEILRRGSPLADGETITLTVTSSGGRISSVAQAGPAKPPLNPAAPNPKEQETVTPPPVPLESTSNPI
jgi:hypothetical protein